MAPCCKVRFHAALATPLSVTYVPAGYILIENCVKGQVVISVRRGAFYASAKATENMLACVPFFESPVQDNIRSIVKILGGGK